MLDAVGSRALAFELCQLAEVIAKPLRARAVEPRPEGRLTDQHAPRQRHSLVVVRHTGHHMNMRIYVRVHISASLSHIGS